MNEKLEQLDDEWGAEIDEDASGQYERPQSFVKPVTAAPRPRSALSSRVSTASSPPPLPAVPRAAAVPQVPPPRPSAPSPADRAERAEADKLLADLQRTRGKLAREREALTAARAEVERLERQLTSQRQRIAVLEADRARCEALEMNSWEVESHGAELRALEARAERAEAELARTTELLADRNGELERLRAEVSRGPAARQDDLTELKGVGPKFARALSRAGVSTFAQIAAWTDADVATIAEQIGTTPGRIHRDRWIESARQLAGRGGAE